MENLEVDILSSETIHNLYIWVTLVCSKPAWEWTFNLILLHVIHSGLCPQLFVTHTLLLNLTLWKKVWKEGMRVAVEEWWACKDNTKTKNGHPIHILGIKQIALHIKRLYIYFIHYKRLPVIFWVLANIAGPPFTWWIFVMTDSNNAGTLVLLWH